MREQKQKRVNTIRHLIWVLAFAVYSILAFNAHTIQAYAEESAPKVDSVSLNLGGSVGVNFYMDLPEQVAKVVIDGTEYSVGEPLNDGCYKFTKTVPAKNMDDIIAIKMLDADDNILTFADGKYTFTYSVSDYLHKVLWNRTAYSAKTVSLCQALSVYGDASACYFGLKQDGVNVKSASISSYDANMNLPSGLKYAGTSLLLNDKVTIRHYFSGDMSLLDNASIGGQKISAQQSGALFYIDIADIPVMKWDVPYTIDIDDQHSISYSVMSYCQKAASVNNEKLANVAFAMYSLCNSAGEYQNWETGMEIISVPESSIVANIGEDVELNIQARGVNSYTWTTYDELGNEYVIGKKAVLNVSSDELKKANYHCTLANKSGESKEYSFNVSWVMGDMEAIDIEYNPVGCVLSASSNQLDPKQSYAFYLYKNGSIIYVFRPNPNGAGVLSENIGESLTESGLYTVELVSISDEGGKSNQTVLGRGSFNVNATKKLPLATNIRCENGYIRWDPVENARAYRAVYCPSDGSIYAHVVSNNYVPMNSSADKPAVKIVPITGNSDEYLSVSGTDCGYFYEDASAEIHVKEAYIMNRSSGYINTPLKLDIKISPECATDKIVVELAPGYEDSAFITYDNELIAHEGDFIGVIIKAIAKDGTVVYTNDRNIYIESTSRVDYELNGGYFPSDLCIGKNYPTIIANFDFNRPYAEKEGAAFAGWYEDEELTIPYNPQYSKASKVYAKYTSDPSEYHTVTFVADKPIIYDPVKERFTTYFTKNVKDGSCVGDIIVANVPRPYNTVFAIEDGCSIDFISKYSDDHYHYLEATEHIYDDVTINVSQIKDYVAVFDAMGGHFSDGEETNTYTFTWDTLVSREQLVESAEVPVWEGREFLGWFLDRECTRSFETSDDKHFGNSGALKYYARWSGESMTAPYLKISSGFAYDCIYVDAFNEDAYYTNWYIDDDGNAVVLSPCFYMQGASSYRWQIDFNSFESDGWHRVYSKASPVADDYDATSGAVSYIDYYVSYEGRLDAPTGLKREGAGISWNPVSGADSYEVRYTVDGYQSGIIAESRNSHYANIFDDSEFVFEVRAKSNSKAPSEWVAISSKDPVITKQPKSTKLYVRESVELTIEAENAQRYEWQTELGNNEWYDVASGNKLVVSNTGSYGFSNRYRCIVTNGNRKVISDVVEVRFVGERGQEEEDEPEVDGYAFVQNVSFDASTSELSLKNVVPGKSYDVLILQDVEYIVLIRSAAISTNMSFNINQHLTKQGHYTIYAYEASDEEYYLDDEYAIDAYVGATKKLQTVSSHSIDGDTVSWNEIPGADGYLITIRGSMYDGFFYGPDKYFVCDDNSFDLNRFYRDINENDRFDEGNNFRIIIRALCYDTRHYLSSDDYYCFYDDKSNIDNLTWLMSDCYDDLYVGQSARFTLEHATGPFEQKDVTFWIDDTDIATVDADGVVKALKPGETLLHATRKGCNKVYTTPITVTKDIVFRYHMNGGYFADMYDGFLEDIVQKDSKHAGSDYAVRRAGLAFVGWYEDAKLTIPYDPEKNYPCFTDLYAKYTADYHTVTFVSDDKIFYCNPMFDGVSQLSLHIPDGQPIGSVYIKPKVGTPYKYMYDDKALNCSIGESKVGTYMYDFYGWYFDEIVTSDMVISAEESYLIYYVDMGDGSDSIGVKITETEYPSYNDVLAKLGYGDSDPVREGADFLGWYEDEDFRNPVSMYSNIAEGATIYAKWNDTNLTPATISFDGRTVIVEANNNDAYYKIYTDSGEVLYESYYPESGVFQKFFPEFGGKSCTIYVDISRDRSAFPERLRKKFELKEHYEPIYIISTNGDDKAGQPGDELAMSVNVANADENTRYQWMKSDNGVWEDIEGANESTYVVASDVTGYMYFKCMVSDDYTTVYSDPFTARWASATDSINLNADGSIDYDLSEGVPYVVEGYRNGTLVYRSYVINDGGSYKVSIEQLVKNMGLSSSGDPFSDFFDKYGTYEIKLYYAKERNTYFKADFVMLRSSSITVDESVPKIPDITGLEFIDDTHISWEAPDVEDASYYYVVRFHTDAYGHYFEIRVDDATECELPVPQFDGEVYVKAMSNDVSKYLHGDFTKCYYSE